MENVNNVEIAKILALILYDINADLAEEVAHEIYEIRDGDTKPRKITAEEINIIYKFWKNYQQIKTKGSNIMENLTYSEVKYLIKETDMESVEAFLAGDLNPAKNYWIIEEYNAIREVYRRYEDDYYALGCFNASFLEDYLPLDYEDIEKLQEAEAYEAIGKILMNSGNFQKMMDDYIATDGFGSALGSYDGGNDGFTPKSGNTLIIMRMN